MAFQKSHESTTQKLSRKDAAIESVPIDKITEGLVTHDRCIGTCTISYICKSIYEEFNFSRQPNGFSMKVIGDPNIDELQLLFKKTIEACEEDFTDACLEQNRSMIEHIYNDLHQMSKIKIESIKTLKQETSCSPSEEKVIPVKCPACKIVSKLPITWGLLEARQKNPAPIWNLLLKGDKTECGHSFIVFVDKFFCIKGCEAID